MAPSLGKQNYKTLVSPVSSFSNMVKSATGFAIISIQNLFIEGNTVTKSTTDDQEA